MVSENRKYDLERFLNAQETSYKTALQEIREGRKRSHWIWFILPQIEGLGFSDMAEYYAIADIDEAKAYLQNKTLHDRLIDICEALLSLPGSDAEEVMGWPDNLKLRSSMTLFREADPDELVFQEVLDKYYAGEPDQRTLEVLSGRKHPD